ncbi:hypothetical protein PILCRDRAFT_499297 [Piloderma croceum F 1598]|uniref:Uncharacterized protein n=1 Tax=Piloderma croceum (strain F 1598) TaxID=765440 RepID=A0A0C3BVF2_PILCF|nr:hypothetical protein PILCRDRAFT_499297 [Piloderma croceum F 1598]
MLNRPVPYDLQVENKRLEIMEHNTLVKYGFKDGVQQPVFDPESETRHGTQSKSIHPKFDLEPTRQNKKRKNENSENPTRSKRKQANKNSIVTTNYDPPPYGCIWSAVDWSCAYDAFFMHSYYTIFFHA